MCALRRQVAWVAAATQTRTDCHRALDVPLFPNEEGEPMSKAQMVSWWKQLAEGFDLGDESVGGHSARRSGAKFFLQMRLAALAGTVPRKVGIRRWAPCF